LPDFIKKRQALQNKDAWGSLRATGAKGGVLCTRFLSRGQKGLICPRRRSKTAWRVQKGRICTRESNDVGKRSDCPRGLKSTTCQPIWTAAQTLDKTKRLTSVTPTGSPSRRNSLRVTSFGPPTVSCVLATARTCIRQAPPTSRGRGLATSAVADRLSGYASSLSFSSFEGLMEALKSWWRLWRSSWPSLSLSGCQSWSRLNRDERAFSYGIFSPEALLQILKSAEALYVLGGRLLKC